MGSIGEILERLKNTRNSLPPDYIQRMTNIQDPPKPTEAEEREDLRQRLNVSSLDHTFANFKPMLGNKDALQAFKLFVSGKLPAPILLCMGINGNGKTHLLEATAITLVKRMDKWPEFIDRLKSKMGKDHEGYSYDEILAMRKQAPVLLIDDIGLGTMGLVNQDKQWEKSILEELVDYRYHNWLPTALTTNLDLEDFSSRIYDRFTDNERCMVVVNEGRSQRNRARELHKQE